MLNDIKQTLTASSTLVGYTIGAGILGLPYVISNVGFITGVIFIIFFSFLILYVNLALGETTLRTKGNHQLVELTSKYLGKNAGWLMCAVLIISMYGSLSAYTVGAGSTIAEIFGGNSIINSVLFLAVLGVIIYFGINTLKHSEFILTTTMVFIILLLLFFGASSMDLSNLTEFSLNNIYYPFGVVMFAFYGLGAMPEMKEELKNKKLMKPAIILAAVITLLIYLAFAALCVGITGAKTTEVATIGLGKVLGGYASILGNLFAIFAMATSFTGIGFALKEIYKLDLKLKPILSWFLVLIFPLLILLLQLAGFIDLLNYFGAVTCSTAIIITLLTFQKSKEKGKRTPEYNVPAYNIIIWAISLLMILAAVFLLLN